MVQAEGKGVEERDGKDAGRDHFGREWRGVV